MAVEGTQARSAAAELLAIPLALVPLVLAWLGSWALYTYADVGRHRPLYDLIRNDEAVFEDTFGTPAPEESGDYAPRWTGTAREKASVVILGSSPSRWDLVKEIARRQTGAANVEIYKLTANVTPVDRVLDRLEIVHDLHPIDVVVIECSLSFVSDYVLGFRHEIETLRREWNPSIPVYDEGILEMAEALGLPAREPGRPKQLRMRREAILSKLDGNDWAAGSDGDRDDYVELESSVANDARLLDNHLLAYVLGRTAELCRVNDIGLVVYVPPANQTLVWHVPPGAPATRIDPVPFSRRALRATASAHGFKVLDYHDWSRDEAQFRDALHLNSRGAVAFSKRFFKDLARTLQANGKDVEYSIVRHDGR